MGINIPARGNAHAALHHCPQVSNNIAEHICSYDDIKPFRVLDHPHGDGIDMGIITFYIRIIRGNLVKGPQPQVMGVGKHIGLGAESEFFLPVPFPGKLKSIAYAALYALAGIDHLLHCNLVGGTLFKESADPAVKSFGVFPHHNKVNILRFFIGQRSLYIGV
ncbi:hypothetical protein ES705_33367 [subsurface metagenome]